ncbi:RES family NAD+ phosphorylase [Legionella feeleii]|uniref:RES domain protein n=1 Tax=Legionella feeleii TaxID=453 RepID=A0A0W0U5W2_9GAMM|nr:RES family NAD+ phosphorylase [Legionella feeleii]KTD03126.1 RES domain protein [Legionella feeleii]SPX61358.1 Uncharacterized conserved protein [Legionella feeleii]
MTLWYRATQSESVGQVFSGEGGIYVSGRWSYKGRKVIYCSQSISLCTLEWLAHHGLTVSGYSYYRFSIEIPEKLTFYADISDLPKEWNLCPASDETREFAEIHLFNQEKYLALAVPSVMVHEEKNLIINPMHPNFLQAVKSVRSLGKFVAPARNN